MSRLEITDDERFAVASALRDWLHRQPFSECNMGCDTCADWPRAKEIRDVALDALVLARASDDE